MARLVGTWDLVNTENFDEYMQALGVNFALRKMGNLAKPTQHISVDGDQYTVKTTSALKNSEFKFKAGEEFDETTADGRKVKTTVTLEGDNKMTQDQKGDPDSVIIRERLDDNTMVMTLEAKGVKCTRKYKLQE